MNVYIYLITLNKKACQKYVLQKVTKEIKTKYFYDFITDI